MRFDPYSEFYTKLYRRDSEAVKHTNAHVLIISHAEAAEFTEKFKYYSNFTCHIYFKGTIGKFVIKQVAAVEFFLCYFVYFLVQNIQLNHSWQFT